MAQAHQGDLLALYETFVEMQSAERVLFRRLASAHDLHENALRALMLSTSQTGSLTPKDVARRLGLASGTITALLDALTTRDLLRRIPNPGDRRGSLLELTPSGQRLAAMVRAMYEAVFEHAVPAERTSALSADLVHLTAEFEARA